MSKENKYITSLNIKATLTENQYIIPIYQRNYAWEDKEIEQLIQDILDYAVTYQQKNYYIGTLVVASNNKESYAFDTIDGQQRLTTLSILSSVINNEYKELEWFNDLNIRFASRKKSMHTLNAVFKGEFTDCKYESNIKAAYDICKRVLDKKIEENDITIDKFINYLYEYVKIIRVQLPDGIDLNHYFEIMNSRGEQLEKHEVLKAKLMSFFENSEKRALYEYCFNLIWEACSNMENYIQYGFTPAQRHLLFGKDDWNELVVDSFDDFVNKISLSKEHTHNTPAYQQEESLFNIDEIISSPAIEIQKRKNENQPDRFNSVVNFQNFLLHVLKVQSNEKNEEEEVALDDKRLLDTFNRLFPKDSEAKETFAKTYVYNLLKCKFYFDKYIIKREFTANTDRWALKSLKWYSSGSVKNGAKYVNTFGEEQSESFDNDNRRILMLLSMFHVSTPSMSYKYWLYAAMRYVFNQAEVAPSKYILYLEHIAKSFVFDNYLALSEQDFHHMINVNLQPKNRAIQDIDFTKLRYDNNPNNLVFNFIDYLLWLDKRDSDVKIKQYEFSFRSSIEHYYPQHPIENITVINDKYLHSIGNLCLISHEKNSRLNNHLPSSKRDYYIKSDSIDSIKQYLMMKELDWGVKEIEVHEKQIVHLLERNLDSAFNWEVGGVTKARKWFKLYKQEDKVLLIRALMCFGCVEFCTGWTSGMEKYNLYQWDRIEASEAYQRYEKYVYENNPASLEDIIKYHLDNDSDIREDLYRYSFISRPYITKYCNEGNFGWSNKGKNFVLLEYNRASIYQSCDLYCYCAKIYLKNEYGTDSYCGSDRLILSISESDNGLKIISSNRNSVAFLEVWNDNQGHLCYELNTRSLHGNSKIIRNLKENGWDYNNNNRFYHTSKHHLLKLSENVEENIQKTELAIEGIIKKIQKI